MLALGYDINKIFLFMNALFACRVLSSVNIHLF